MTTTTALLFFCLTVSASPGDAWPGFRGTGDSVSLAKSVPIEWSDDTVAWRRPLEGYGQSSPIVFGDRVFVTSMVGQEKETAVISAFALTSGKPLWQYRFSSSQTAKATNMVSRGAPTPYCDQAGVFALFESGDLIAMSHVGELKWRRSVSKDYGEIQGNHGISGSLVANDDCVFVLINHGGPSYFMACDKASGETVWKTDYEPRVSWSSPVLAHRNGSNSDLLVVSGGGRLDAYDAIDGRSVWFLEGIDGNNVPSATTTESQVWVGSSQVGQNFGIALQGEGNRSSEQPTAVCDKASCTFSSSLVYRGNIYCVSRAGIAYCNDATDGKLLWKHRISTSCWASHVGNGEHIYFFSKDGTTTVVAASNKLTVLGTNQLTIGAQARVYGVAFVDHRILLRTGQELICVAGKGILNE